MERPSASDDDDPREAQFSLLPHDESDDVEANVQSGEGLEEKPSGELEYETPNAVKFLWLGTYFFFSLMLTLYNKLVLGSVSSLWTEIIYERIC